MARRPLPPAQKRSVKLFTKTYPGAAAEFRAIAAALGLTDAAAIRDALADWVNKHRGALKK